MVYLQVRLIENNINIHKMKRETKTVVEYTAPRCKELAFVAELPVLQSSIIGADEDDYGEY